MPHLASRSLDAPHRMLNKVFGSNVGRQSYRGTSLIRKRLPLGPYSRPIPRALWWSMGGGLFLMSEVPLYPCFFFITLEPEVE